MSEEIFALRVYHARHIFQENVYDTGKGLSCFIRGLTTTDLEKRLFDYIATGKLDLRTK